MAECPTVFGLPLTDVGLIKTRRGIRRLWETEKAPDDVTASIEGILATTAGAAVCSRLGIATGWNRSICVWRPEDAPVPEQAEIDAVLAEAAAAAQEERDEWARTMAEAQATTAARYDELARLYKTERWAFRTPILAIWEPIMARGKIGLDYFEMQMLIADVREYIDGGQDYKRRKVARMAKRGLGW